MSYTVLSRKWRPQIFEDIIGQDHITKTLKNAINLNRVAHGYLFFGPRGVGKTTCARILAKALNCLKIDNSNPCNSCNNCNQILNGSSLDVLEIDGASNRGIDEIRELREAVKYPPSSGNYRIYIIDEVHMLTQQAFNALLKTLEEPPSHVKFIMATTEAYKVPQTILSRTMRFNFHRISSDLIFNHLTYILNKENIEYEDNSIKLISKKGDGSLRDSLSFLDQIISYSDYAIELNIVKQVLGIIEESIYLDLLIHCYNKDNSEVLSICNNIFESGTPILDCIKGWNDFIRDILLLKSNQNKISSLSAKSKEFILKDLKKYKYMDFLRILNLSLEFELKTSKIDQIEIAFELLMLKICAMDSSIEITEILKVANNSDEYILDDIKNKKLNYNNIKINTVQKKNSEPVIDKVVKEVQYRENNNSNEIELSLEYFINNWIKIRNDIEKVDSKLNIFLEDSIPTSFLNNELEITLPDGNMFQAKNLQKNITFFENSILNRTKKNIKIKFHSKELEKNKSKENPLNRNHPLIDEAIEMFNGEIIK